MKKFAAIALLWASAAFGQVFTTLYLPTQGAGLTLNIAAGRAFCGGSVVSYAGGTLTMAASVTNRVYLNTASSCVPAVKSSAFTSSDIPVATVVTSGSAITGLTDNRTMFSQPPSGFSNPMTTLGDFIVGGSSGTPHRLGVGADGQVVTADHTATNGVKWGDPAASGVQYNPANTQHLWFGGSRLIVNGSPLLTATSYACTSGTCVITTGATNTLLTGHDAAFNSDWASCFGGGNAHVYPITAANSTTFTVTASSCASTSGSGGTYWNGDTSIPERASLTEPFYAGHGTMRNYAIGATNLAYFVTNYTSYMHPLISAAVTAAAGAPVYVHLLTAGSDGVATDESKYLSLWASIHAEGSNVYVIEPTQVVGGPSPFNSIFYTRQVQDWDLENLWMIKQGDKTTAPATGQYWDRIVPIDALTSNFNLYNVDGIHFNSGGTAAVAQAFNDAMASQDSLGTGAYISKGGVNNELGTIWTVDPSNTGNMCSWKWGVSGYAGIYTLTCGDDLVSNNATHYISLALGGIDINQNPLIWRGNGTHSVVGTTNIDQESEGVARLNAHYSGGDTGAGGGLHLGAVRMQASAPTGSCGSYLDSNKGWWILSQDGGITYCNTGTGLWTTFSSGGGTTTNALTMNNSGAGDASGSTFNGIAAKTISYNTIGAAPLVSPALTGTPTAPTAAPGTNTTQLASTAFVQAAVTAAGTAFSGGLGTSFQDVTETAAPANPAAGNDRLYTNSTTHKLACITPGGADCMPASGGGTSIAQNSGSAETSLSVTGFMPQVCSDTSGSGTAQNCTVANTFVPQAGNCIVYKTTTANSGTGLTVNINSLGAKSVAVAGSSGWTTTLTATLSIPANKPLNLCYDGTNFNASGTGYLPSSATNIPVWQFDDFVGGGQGGVYPGALGWGVNTAGSGHTRGVISPSSVTGGTNLIGILELGGSTSTNGWQQFTLGQVNPGMTWLQSGSGGVSVATSMIMIDTAQGLAVWGLGVSGASIPSNFTGFQVSTRDNGNSNWWYLINGGTHVDTGVSATAAFHQFEIVASHLSVTLYMDGVSIATGSVTANSYSVLYNLQNETGGTQPEIAIDWFAIKNSVISNLL